MILVDFDYCAYKYFKVLWVKTLKHCSLSTWRCRWSLGSTSSLLLFVCRWSLGSPNSPLSSLETSFSLVTSYISNLATTIEHHSIFFPLKKWQNTFNSATEHQRISFFCLFSWEYSVHHVFYRHSSRCWSFHEATRVPKKGGYKHFFAFRGS